MASTAAISLILEPSAQPTQPKTVDLKLLQIWQWEGRTLQDAIAACKASGFTGLLVKALDGTAWMGGGIDPSPWALGSPAEVQAQADVAHLAGLYYFVWTNPLATGDLSLQARLTAAAANACDGLFLDVEPYAQFWGPWRPVGMAGDFMLAVRNQAPNAFIALQPDPREAHLNEIRVLEWLLYCDALAGQHYWSDFRSDPVDELEYAMQLAARYSVPVLPTLPGNAPITSFPVNWIARFPGFAVWRWGTTPPATLTMLGDVAVIGLETSKIKALA